MKLECNTVAPMRILALEPVGAWGSQYPKSQIRQGPHASKNPVVGGCMGVMLWIVHVIKLNKSYALKHHLFIIISIISILHQHHCKYHIIIVNIIIILYQHIHLYNRLYTCRIYCIFWYQGKL